MDDDGEYVQDSEKLSAFGSEAGKATMTTANGRLWIKLKIPKSAELSGEESVHDHDSPTEKETPCRICNVCNKGFRSGKALGAHMRIHIQANKELLLKKTQNPKLKKHLTHLSGMATSSECVDTMNNSIPTCSLCGKNFPSMKSLFGHMRCHPERKWRGIQPPSTAKNSSSSTVSDALVQKMDDHIDSATTTVGSLVDLSVSLSRWSVTAKRGRKSTASTAATGNANASSSGSDPHHINIPDVVHGLMMLAQGHGNKQRVDVSEATNSNSLTNKTEIEDKNQASKKRRIEASPVRYSNEINIVLKKMERGKGKGLVESGWEANRDSGGVDHMDEWDGKINSDGEELNHSCMVNRKILMKKQKKRNLRDLETGIHKQNPVLVPDGYKCSTCNKSFLTHQALGGHRSSHNKVVKNSHTMDESAYASAAEDEHYANPTTQECQEAASSRVVVAPRQCQICNKTFPTGQALGGHKRCHWTAPADAPSPGQASQTGHRIFSFDLNEVPGMEDEEGIESAITQPEHASSSYNSVI